MQEESYNREEGRRESEEEREGETETEGRVGQVCPPAALFRTEVITEFLPPGNLSKPGLAQVKAPGWGRTSVDIRTLMKAPEPS